jgi:osmoprotectant transport system permease protein
MNGDCIQLNYSGDNKGAVKNGLLNGHSLVWFKGLFLRQQLQHLSAIGDSIMAALKGSNYLYCLATLIGYGLSIVQATAQTNPLSSDSSQTIRIGSKRFTESYILAELLAQTAQSAAAKAQVLQGLGNTAIVFEALKSGQIDAYAEYTGTIATEILKASPDMALQPMQAALAKQGLGVAVPFGFNDGYALAMLAADADRLGIRSLSDLVKHPELKLGLSNEFIGRQDGWKGLSSRYKLAHMPLGLDHGLAYTAIQKKQIDVMDIYTTDAKINHLGLRVLVDDQNYFPRYDAIVLYRLDVLQKHPAAWAAIQKLEGRISEAQMIAMNAEAELQSQPFDVIAKQFLAPINGLQANTTKPSKTSSQPTPKNFFQQLWQRLWADDLGRLMGQHLLLVLASVGAACLIAVPLAISIYRQTKLRALVLGTASVLQTVPSLALLVVFIAALGTIGFWPALLALTLYAVLPILRNTCTGLAEVSKGQRYAAQALGMTTSQSLRLVELPAAMPTVMAGVRTASSIAIGTATIAAFVGAGGLGERIVTGLALNDSALMLAGAIPAAALALASELLFEAMATWRR